MDRLGGAGDARQRRFYERTADRYDEYHASHPEHEFALSLLSGVIEYVGASSVLDVGAGTGRVQRYMGSFKPHVTTQGVEPSDALRRVAIERGLAASSIEPGDARSLVFADNEFDLVTAFGLLHHVSQPELAIEEMLRVARLGVLISDANVFGQGGFAVRSLKQAIHRVGLWPLAVQIKTRGRGFHESETDGVFFPYSVFDNLAAIERSCAEVRLVSTRNSSPNLYRTASHVALVGLMVQPK